MFTSCLIRARPSVSVRQTRATTTRIQNQVTRTRSHATWFLFRQGMKFYNVQQQVGKLWGETHQRAFSPCLQISSLYLTIRRAAAAKKSLRSPQRAFCFMIICRFSFFVHSLMVSDGKQEDIVQKFCAFFRGFNSRFCFRIKQFRESIVMRNLVKCA